MTKSSTSQIFIIAILVGITWQMPAQTAHNQHAYTHHDHEAVTASHHRHAHQSKLVTGQGDFVFSWDQELTAAFPEDAAEFEAGMHGGFNEDPETGIVYTGIPGYGLCAISPDLSEWTTIGTDERLKDNIHGIVFFVHKGVKHLALGTRRKKSTGSNTEWKDYQ